MEVIKRLNVLGYGITVAADGAEAVELYKASMQSGAPFDVVILDLTVPGGMGGKEAVQKLIAMAPDVKVIVSSGYSNNPIMTDFRRYGFTGVIDKPYRVSELKAALHKVIVENA